MTYSDALITGGIQDFGALLFNSRLSKNYAYMHIFVIKFTTKINDV